MVTSGDNSVAVTLSDGDMLTCPICCNYLTVPVYQCENGHVLCSPCLLKLMNKCPSCSLPSGRIRCRFAEKVLESFKVTCKNKKFGCIETISFNVVHDHEKKSCFYTPCLCPFSTCKFVGSQFQLNTHFSSNHSQSGLITDFSYDHGFNISVHLSANDIVLLERTAHTVFVLSNRTEPGGNALYVSRIGPSCSGTGLLYDLILRDESSCLMLQAPTTIIQELVSQPLPNKFLMVPNSAFDVSKKIKLELKIWRLKRPVPV